MDGDQIAISIFINEFTLLATLQFCHTRFDLTYPLYILIF